MRRPEGNHRGRGPAILQPRPESEDANPLIAVTVQRQIGNLASADAKHHQLVVVRQKVARVLMAKGQPGRW